MIKTLPDQILSKKLAEILETWPLYREHKYRGGTSVTVLPKVIFLDCPTCTKAQIWETSISNYTKHNVGFCDASYRCRNCQRGQTYYWFYWYEHEGLTTFFKVGQYPPLEDRPSPELGKQLDADDLDLYNKALRSRNFNFGLGALAYLRRVVENRMNDLLELVAEAARNSGFAAEDLKEIERIKQSKRFNDKVTYAAKLLPPHLKPGGHNPIDLLHDLASQGIHSKPEVECIEIFDKSRLVFEYLFRELNVRKEKSIEFTTTRKELLSKKSQAGL